MKLTACSQDLTGLANQARQHHARCHVFPQARGVEGLYKALNFIAQWPYVRWTGKSIAAYERTTEVSIRAMGV